MEHMKGENGKAHTHINKIIINIINSFQCPDNKHIYSSDIQQCLDLFNTLRTCDNKQWKLTLNGNGECFTRPADSDTYISESFFSLSPFSNANCGTISYDVCSNDVQSNDECTEFCNANFQCLSGYCNTAMCVCC